MARTKKGARSLKEKIIKYFMEYPNDAPTKVARMFKCNVNNLYTYRKIAQDKLNNTTNKVVDTLEQDAKEFLSAFNAATVQAAKETIDTLLDDRGETYGPFLTHALITQQIKCAMSQTDKWNDLAVDQAEALEMIAHKIGRIVNGNPDYIDSWVDIAGYAKLVADRLGGNQR